ncbi:MAG: hypothetical protein ACR2PZ_00115 [Pseudomonadales bacterium]
MQLLSATGIAMVVLLIAVLPAEYAIDPTGLGERFGLTKLAPTEQANTRALTHWLSEPSLESRNRPLLGEQLQFELGPFESVEYKYRLQAGEGLLYRWHSSGPVVVNFHSEPDALVTLEPGKEAAISFNNGRSNANSGTYVAPFTGIHGWFWQNRGPQPVTLELHSAGFFNTAIDYRGGFPFEKNLNHLEN